MSGRRDIAAAATLLVATWGAGAILPIGVDRPGAVYVVSDLVYSAMLASYAAVGWLATRLVPGRLSVRAFAWLLAGAGLAGAVGNVLEDIVAVSGAEYLYGLGFFGSVIGFIGLTAVLLAARAVWLALVVGATLGGVVVMAGHGPPVVPILWLAIALWTVLGSAATEAAVASASGADETSPPRSSSR